jgi:hypothetical protein
MATTVYTLDSTWSSSARYTAAGDVDVRIGNPNDTTAIHYVITTSDTTPSTDPANANKVGVYGSDTVVLAASDRLWFCGSKGYATIEVL